VGAALLTTFAGGAITTVIHRALDANDWTYVPPPPPRPVPEPKCRRAALRRIDTTPPSLKTWPRHAAGAGRAVHPAADR
jgi:protein TonB